MPSTRVLILRAPGANCDGETQYAFELAGALPERLHVNRLRENPALLQRFQVLQLGRTEEQLEASICHSFTGGEAGLDGLEPVVAVNGLETQAAQPLPDR